MQGLSEELSNSQGEEDLANLAGRLLDFAPGVNGEQLTEEQEAALKKATVYFYKQLMLQQNKSSQPVNKNNNNNTLFCKRVGGNTSPRAFFPFFILGSHIFGRFPRATCVEYVAKREAKRIY